MDAQYTWEHIIHSKTQHLLSPGFEGTESRKAAAANSIFAPPLCYHFL